MKLLILAARLPHPKGKADSMTVYRIIDFFAPRHEIHLACFAEKNPDPEHVKHLQILCKSVTIIPIKRWKTLVHMAAGVLKRRPLQVSYYLDGSMQKAVRELITRENPDLIYAHMMRTCEYVKDVRDRPTVLAIQLSQTLNTRRMIEHIRQPFYKLLYSVEYACIRHYEPRMTHNFTSCLMISEHDKQAMEGHESIHNIFYSPHGVDYKYYTRTPATYEDNAILFCGVLETPTNLDAVLYFYHDIYPLVKKERPDVKLYLLGKNPPESIKRIVDKDPTVVVTGFVEDIRPYYSKVRVGIDPIRIGAGLQNKLLVGMSMAQAMVSTTVANEGIGGKDGEHLVIADTPADFATAVVRLVNNPAVAEAMGIRARRFIEARWSWEYYFEQLEEHFKELVAKQPVTKA